MAKQILVGIEEQNLNEVAHYLVIYFPYNEEMCSYTDDWLGELYENKYPLVSKGMWSGIIDLKVHKLLDCILDMIHILIFKNGSHTFCLTGLSLDFKDDAFAFEPYQEVQFKPTVLMEIV